MQSPAQSAPPQQNAPRWQSRGHEERHLPFSQIKSPVPNGSRPHVSLAVQGQFTVPSGQVSTTSHQSP